jgi:hypothetical protein
MAEVELYRRTLHTTHTVNVDVIATLVHVDVEALLAVDFDVVDAVAEVARGRLTSLRLRDPKVSGQVSASVDSVDAGPLFGREGTLLLGERLTFDPGLQILSDAQEQSVTRIRPT